MFFAIFSFVLERLKTYPWLVFFIFLLWGFLIYSNSFGVSFHFDDLPNIIENPYIKDFSNFWNLKPTRYVGYFTFALNHYFGGWNVFGYHAVNFSIHILNAFFVYQWALLLFQTPKLENFPEDRVVPVALTTAVLFLVHPVQTQAVTYIVQRLASLMTLFYLGALIGYLQWRLGEERREKKNFWYALALICTLLAMKTKENSFTILGTLMLLEMVCFEGMNKKRLRKLAPFFFCLAVIPISLWAAKLTQGQFGYRDVTHISVTDYLFTQFPVLMTYLRLIFWPAGQNLDYDYPIYHNFLDPTVFVSFLCVAALVAWGLRGCFSKRFQGEEKLGQRLLAFGVVWFFWTLSIESSFVPVGDVIFEHRLYLPAIGLFFGLMSFLFYEFTTVSSSVWRLGLVGIAALVLSFAAHERNKVWKDEVSLWEDIASKSPNKGRVRLNLGAAYDHVGRLEEAMKEYEVALNLDPKNVEVYNNLGTIYGREGHLDEAMKQFELALKIQPDHYGTHYNLGLAYKGLGMKEKAIAEMETVLKIKPDFDLARETLETLKRMP